MSAQRVVYYRSYILQCSDAPGGQGLWSPVVRLTKTDELYLRVLTFAAEHYATKESAVSAAEKHGRHWVDQQLDGKALTKRGILKG